MTWLRDDVWEERRQIRPPIQPVCEEGDIMLRDLRTWHAGMPNESDDYRIMLALGYQVCLFILTSVVPTATCQSVSGFHVRTDCVVLGSMVSESHAEI